MRPPPVSDHISLTLWVVAYGRFDCIYLTIIPRARVGYEMIRVGYNHLISNKREWNNCFIKNNQEVLLDLVGFALQEQREDNLAVAISWAWYNNSYTMAAKSIKSLEFHYTMIQFLINIYT